MKRLLSLAVLGTAALLLPSSVAYAQRGAAHGGGGSGFHSSGGGGFHSSGSMGGGFRSAAPSGFRAGGGFQSSGFRSSGVRSSGFRSQGFRSQGFRSSGFRNSGVSVARTGGFRTFGSRGATVRVSSGRAFSRSFGASRIGVGRNVFFRAGFNRFGFRRFGFFDRCFGCFSPFFFSGGFFWGSPFYPYYPYYPGDYYGYPYNYGYSSDYAPTSYSDNGDTAQLSADVQRLSDEVADMKDSDGYTHFSDRGPVPPGTSLSAKDPAVSTIFIFRDGNRISGQNYAITGATLWVFNEHSARKFQMSDLDADATEKANAANGIEFHVPEAGDRH